MFLSRALIASATLLTLACQEGTVSSGARAEVDFDALLAPPSAGEIAAVRESWAERDLTPRDVEIVGRHRVEMDHAVYEARVIGLTLDDDRQYGIAFVPEGADEPLPLIAGARGVRWDYPVRDLSNGPYVARIMGAHQADVIVLSPVLRGHSARIGETRYDSEGDQRDSWDGATDDMIAFVTAAAEIVPEVDAGRVAGFGFSRGAAVALLHAARDERIDAVVAYSAPVDFFDLMGRPGEDWGEALARAWRDPDFPPDSRESQFVEWFLEDRTHLSMEALRRRLLASSALYFLDALPPAQLHQGAEDSSVQAANALAVQARFEELGYPDDAYQVRVHPDAGHLLQGSNADELAREFLRRRLGIDE